MSAIDNDTLRRLLAAATPGEWEARVADPLHVVWDVCVGDRCVATAYAESRRAEADATLCAAAPELAREVLALRPAVSAIAEKARHGARQLAALTADVDALRAEIAARKDARAELLALRAVAQVFLAAEADPAAQRPGSDAAEHLVVARAVLAEASREKLS